MKLKLNLGPKFVAFITITLLFLGVILFVVNQSSMQNALEKEKEHELKSVVEVGMDILKIFYELEQSGEMSRELAQENTKNILRRMTYGENDDYYYINNPVGVSIMHPDLNVEGKDMSAVKDVDGVAPFKDLGTIAKAEGSGFLMYRWNYYGDENRIEPKMAYGSYFEPWDWVLGTSFYINDINERIVTLRNKSIIITALLLAISMFISYLFIRSITKPILVAINLATSIGKRDLSVKVDKKLLSKTDEIGALANSLENMKNSFSDIVKDITGGVGNLTDSSLELNSVSDTLNAAVSNTTQRITTVASAIEEMNVNMNNSAAGIEQTSTNLNSIASASIQMNATITEISKNTEKAKEVTDSAVELTSKVSTNINTLGDSAKAIGNVTETISNISSQTNLLALNATIEAARAGSAGKGFAVVAGEIKDLAYQTATATEDIKNRILGIQNAVNLSIGDINSVSEVVIQVNQIVNTIAAAIEEQSITTRDISNNINEASTGVEETARLVAESAAVTSDSAENITKVVDSTNDVATQGEKIVDSISELNNLAQKLQNIVNLFKLG